MKRVLIAVVLILSSGCGRVQRDQAIRAARQASPHEWKEQALGTFVVRSGVLLVLDPRCVLGGSSGDLQGLVRGAKPGTWQGVVFTARAAPNDTRCGELMAHHADHPPQSNDLWERAPNLIAVDSGQAGIFENATVGKDSVIPQGYFGEEGPLVSEELWYSMCCKQTLGAMGAGVVPGGAVSSAGWGDGGYCWYARYADRQVVGVRIVFLDEQDLE